MVEMRKAGRVREKELDRMEMLEALRHGNIYEVLAQSKDFKINDFFDFFANQWKQWRGNVIQDLSVKSEWASYRGADINEFNVHHRGAAIPPEAGEHFADEMMGWLSGGGRFKATTAGAQVAPPPEGEEMSLEELEDMARGTLAEWDQFLGDSWSQIFDAQMMSDYRSRMAEIKRES